MSINFLSIELKRFISSTHPEIICIKGKWGIGKTYAWRNYLKAAQREKSIGLKQYSYVSLFGRNSLSDLRNAIVENSVSTDDVEAKPSITSLEYNTSVFRQGLNKVGLLAQYFPKTDKYAEGLQRLMFLLARNKIVCLDDLERAGSGLNVKDVLGLALQLKDEKGCKVAILLNDEKLEGKEKIEFDDQLEKVADIIFTFDPTPEEALQIALSENGIVQDQIAKNCSKLKITNIRVIKKAEAFCVKISHILSGLDHRVLEQAIHTATLASFAKFQPKDAPDIEYILKYDPYAHYWPSDKGDKPKEPDANTILLQAYDFGAADDFDKSIISGIVRGFFDEENVRKLGESVNLNLAQNDKSTAYREAWSIYHDSYDDNAEEIITSLDRSLRTNISVLDISSLDSTVIVMRELGAAEKATKLIEFYVENKNGTAETWDAEAYSYRGGIRDPEVLKACSEKLTSYGILLSPLETLKKVGNSQSWNYKDDALLANTSIDDFKIILKSVRGEDRSSIVSAAKLYLSIGNPSKDVSQIQTNLSTALSQIASESELNRRRIKGVFGIEPQ